jgi:4,5-dihydroxyphthalate decarboxylase
MAGLALTLATRDYDFVAPLALGDVRPEGIDLTLYRGFDALARVTGDSGVHGGEASFGRYVQRLAAGDRTFVGLPAFVMREFRHRSFFVRADSRLRDVGGLAGKRVGMDAWPNSGNTWSRALMREAGATHDRVEWVVGPVNRGDAAPPADALPKGVTAAPPGRTLTEMVVAGELDAFTWAWAPAGFYEGTSGLRRLYPDFRAAERDHYRRTRVYPAHHLVVLRRDTVERHPRVVGSVYAAFHQARERAEASRLMLHESSAWLLADLEEQAEVLGRDFRPYGYRENQRMVAAFCEEQRAQGLIPAPIDPDAVFADFERLVAAP